MLTMRTVYVRVLCDVGLFNLSGASNDIVAFAFCAIVRIGHCERTSEPEIELTVHINHLALS